MRLLAAICLVLCIGCSHSHKQSNSVPRRSQFATTELPTPAPTPDTRPPKQDITAAQADVRQVLATVPDSPATASAKNTLTDADAKLTSGLEKLDKVQSAIETSESVHKQREEAMQSDLSKAKVITTDANKQITALEAENAELKDAQLRKMQFILYAIGTLLCLGSIGMLALRIYTGFAMGSTIGAFAAPTGLAALGFAKMLPRLSEYAEIGVAVAIVVGFLSAIWAIWHALRHVPANSSAVPNSSSGGK